MIFDGRPTRDIVVDELRRLITDHAVEDQHLDYKQEPYSSTDAGAKELIKDVTAFANADGGYIIIGVAEDGERRAARFVNVQDAEVVRRSILDRCLAKIDPRPELDAGAFQVDGSTMLVVHVPESGRKPHCARPDAEHHYFWRRYEDGVKLMSPAEIRECFEGDTVHRQLAGIHRDIAELHREKVVARETEMPVDEGNLFQLQTPEAFLQHVDRQFLAIIDSRPYYRLWATPMPVNQLDLHGRKADLMGILRTPPKLRDDGWDITPVGDFRQTAAGLVCDRVDFRHLRLLWNGHLEFWTAVDNASFHWDEFNAEPPYRLLFPYAIIESAECFVRLVGGICGTAGYQGEVTFGLGLYNIQGQYLLPGAPETFGYARRRAEIDQPHGPQPFPGQNLLAAPITARADDPARTVTWRLVSSVYYGFGYADDEVPFFDARNHCILASGSGEQA